MHALRPVHAACDACGKCFCCKYAAPACASQIAALPADPLLCKMRSPSAAEKAVLKYERLAGKLKQSTTEFLWCAKNDTVSVYRPWGVQVP